MKIRLEKLSELADARSPNNLPVGFVEVGEMYVEPKVGENFWVGRDFRTSKVQEVIDDHTFRTHNSIYRWSEITGSDDKE
jgi:hypothetical protein